MSERLGTVLVSGKVCEVNFKVTWGEGGQCREVTVGEGAQCREVTGGEGAQCREVTGGEGGQCREVEGIAMVCRMSGTDSLCWTAASKKMGTDILFGEFTDCLLNESEIKKK